MVGGLDGRLVVVTGGIYVLGGTVGRLVVTGGLKEIMNVMLNLLVLNVVLF